MGDELLVQNRITRENQHFFLNNTEIPGIQSVQGQWDSNLSPIKFIGMDSTPIFPQGEQKGQINLSYLLIDHDSFLPFTGNSGFNGYIIKNRNNIPQNYSFTSGYLISYNSRCRIGEIPECQVSVGVLGNLGRLTSSESSAVSGDFLSISTGSFQYALKIASPGSISISMDDFITNRLLSYNLLITCNRRAIYTIGSRFPSQVDIVYPMQVDCSLEYDVNDYAPEPMRNAPGIIKAEKFELTIKSYDRVETIVSHSFCDMVLVGESYNTDVNGNVTVLANYRTFINRNERYNCYEYLVDESGKYISDESLNIYRV